MVQISPAGIEIRQSNPSVPTTEDDPVIEVAEFYELISDINILYDCALLSTAVYENSPTVFLQSNHHRFTSVYAKSGQELPFMMAEIIDSTPAGPRKIFFLAVRGTMEISDWATNINVIPSPEHYGLVHGGFLKRAKDIPVKYIFEEKLLQGYEIYLTGHSLGGAIAQISTVEILTDLIPHALFNDLKVKVHCITFGSPLVIIGNGATQLENVYRSNFMNFIDPKDVVPKLLSWLTILLNRPNTSKDKSVILDALTLVGKIISDGFTWQTILTGFAQLASSPLVKKIICDTFNYLPLGQYIVLRPEDMRTLTFERAKQYLSFFDSFTLKTDCYVPHSMNNSYLANLKYNFGFDLGGYKGDRPSEMRLVEASINFVDVTTRGDRASVQVKGHHVGIIKTLKSSDILGVASVDSSVFDGSWKCQVDNLFSEAKLLPRPSRSFPRALNQGLTITRTCALSYTTFFGDSKTVNPSASINSQHAYERSSLKGILMAACYWLMLLGQQQAISTTNAASANTSSEIPAMQDIRNTVENILSLVPIFLFIDISNDIGTYFMRNKVWRDLIWAISRKFTHDRMVAYAEAVKSHKSTDESFKAEMKQFLEDSRTVPYAKDPIDPSWSDVMKAAAERNIPINSSMTNNVFISLSADLKEAENVLRGDITQENYEQYIIQVGRLHQKIACSICIPVALFYDPYGEDDGPIEKQADSLAKNPLFLKIAIATTGPAALAAGIAVAYVTAITGVFAAPFTFGASLALLSVSTVMVASAIVAFNNSTWWNGHVLNSVDGLRTNIVQTLKLSDVQYKSLRSPGEKDRFIAQNLVSKGFTKNKTVKEIRQLMFQSWDQLYLIGPEEKHAFSVARRMQLIILANELRAKLKALPVIMLYGLSTSGKSTLAELLCNPENPDMENAFGSSADHRTSCPTLRLCQTNGKVYGLLDTVGIGSLGTNDQEIRKWFNDARNLLSLFSTAMIIVCEQNDDSRGGVARELAFMTSDMDISEASEVVHQPTLTCFNKADHAADSVSGFDTGKFKVDGKISALKVEEFLRVEAEKRRKVNKPYDLRTIAEDEILPRVFSCFHPTVKLPEFDPNDINRYKNSVLLTPKDVNKWIIDTIDSINRSQT